MTTLWSWSSSADGNPFEAFTGTAPTVTTSGSYGERYVWPSTTVVSYGRRAVSSVGDHGLRFIYSVASYATVSHAVSMGYDGVSATTQWRVDLTSAGLLRIRNASATVTTGTVGLAAGVEYRFEIMRSGTTLTVKAYRVSDNVLMDTISGTVGGATLTYVYLGNNATLSGSTLGSFTFDEMVLTNTAAEVGQVAGTNLAPIANASADFTVDPNVAGTFTLTGTGTDSDGTIASYVWDDITGTPTAVPGSGASRTVTIPTSTSGSTRTYRLTVTDNGGATSTDTVVVTVLPHTRWLFTSGGLIPIRRAL